MQSEKKNNTRSHLHPTSVNRSHVPRPRGDPGRARARRAHAGLRPADPVNQRALRPARRPSRAGAPPLSAPGARGRRVALGARPAVAVAPHWRAPGDRGGVCRARVCDEPGRHGRGGRVLCDRYPQPTNGFRFPWCSAAIRSSKRSSALTGYAESQRRMGSRDRTRPSTMSS